MMSASHSLALVRRMIETMRGNDIEEVSTRREEHCMICSGWAEEERGGGGRRAGAWDVAERVAPYVC